MNMNSVSVEARSEDGPSLQVIQDIYNQLTGKLETVHRAFFDYHRITVNDLDNLHKLVERTVEIHECQASNVTVTVRYCDGKTERFSGFNRFSLHGVGRSSATEYVEFEYDFLIKLPKVEKGRPYKFIISVRSTMGLVEAMTRAGEKASRIRFFQDLYPATAKLEVHYVDIALARSWEAIIEDWYKGLRKTNSN